VCVFEFLASYGPVKVEACYLVIAITQLMPWCLRLSDPFFVEIVGRSKKLCDWFEPL